MKKLTALIILLGTALPSTGYGYVRLDQPAASAHIAWREDLRSFQYIVIFPPPEEGEEPPLSTTAIEKYCAAAQEWSRRIYEATDGQHIVSRVHFFHDTLDPPAIAPVD